MRKELQWFKDRIGEIVYRTTHTSCKCSVCADVFNRGLIISDETHAHYLYNCQNELGLQYEDNQTKQIL